MQGKNLIATAKEQIGTILVFRNYNCYFCNCLAEVHILSISEKGSFHVRHHHQLFCTHQVKHVLGFPFLFFLCVFTQTGVIWRKILDPHVLLHSNLLLQRPVSSGHSLRDPAHQSHHEEFEENRQLQGLRNNKQSTERQIEVLEENLILGDSISDCRNINRYPQPLRNMRMRKIAAFSPYFLILFSKLIFKTDFFGLIGFISHLQYN